MLSQVPHITPHTMIGIVGTALILHSLASRLESALAVATRCHRMRDTLGPRKASYLMSEPIRHRTYFRSLLPDFDNDCVLNCMGWLRAGRAKRKTLDKSEVLVST